MRIIERRMLRWTYVILRETGLRWNYWRQGENGLYGEQDKKNEIELRHAKEKVHSDPWRIWKIGPSVGIWNVEVIRKKEVSIKNN